MSGLLLPRPAFSKVDSCTWKWKFGTHTSPNLQRKCIQYYIPLSIFIHLKCYLIQARHNKAGLILNSNWCTFHQKAPDWDCRLWPCELWHCDIVDCDMSSGIRWESTWLRLQIVTEGKSTSDRDAVVSSIEVSGFCWSLQWRIIFVQQMLFTEEKGLTQKTWMNSK